MEWSGYRIGACYVNWPVLLRWFLVSGFWFSFLVSRFSLGVVVVVWGWRENLG